MRSLPFQVIRVKLPIPTPYDAGKEKHTEYDSELTRVLENATPVGFKVASMILVNYPVDREGHTWLPVECLSRDAAIQDLTASLHLRNQTIETICHNLERTIKEAKRLS